MAALVPYGVEGLELSAPSVMRAGKYLANADMAARIIQRAWRGYKGAKAAYKVGKRTYSQMRSFRGAGGGRHYRSKSVPASRNSKKRKTNSKKMNYSGVVQSTSVDGLTIKIPGFTKGSINKAPVYRKIVEDHGSVTDDEAVYLGYGAPYNELCKAVIRVIVHALFSKAGIRKKSWADAVEGTFVIVIKYYSSLTADSVTSLSAPSTPAANKDMEALADDVLTVTQNTFSAFAVPRLYEAQLRRTTASGEVISEIDLSAFKIKLSYSQRYAIQNQTLAGEATGTSTHDESMLSIQRNPVYGKIMYRKGNALIPKHRQSQVGYVGFVSWGDYGKIATNASTQWTEENQKHTSSNTFEGAPIKGRFTLNPGSVVHISNFNSAVRTVNGWFNELYEWFRTSNGGSDEKLKHFGTIMLCSFEKTMDVGTDENNLKIDYELETKVSAAYTYKQKHRMRDVFDRV